MKTFATLLATTALLGATALPALAIVLDGTIVIKMYEPTASNVCC